jgi:hypothetical protein
MLNAHIAFDSDCFSHAIANTRRYLPDCTKLAATTPVDPPTELGHHHALEEVWRLADDYGVDVVECRTGVGQGLVDRLTHQAVHRHVLPLGDVLRLPGAQHRRELPGH